MLSKMAAVKFLLADSGSILTLATVALFFSVFPPFDVIKPE